MIRYLILAVVVSCGVLRGGDEQLRTAPTTQPVRYTGKTLPTPPRQKAAWTLPQSRLPEKLLSSIDPLFAQGVADPRGCEYREAEVAVGNVWNGGGGAVRTHAWALPPDKGSAQRFVVCWNGLVYPASFVGEKVDIHADVAASIKAAQPARDGVTTEDVAVSYESRTMLKAAMLLRAGETALAEDYWLHLSPEHGTENSDPYLSLAAEWAWYAWDRAVCAHMRGDDGVSLASAKVLAAAQPQIETTAAVRGFKRPLPIDRDSRNRNPVNPPYLGGTYQMAAKLQADEERRVNAADQPLPLDEAEKISDKAKRIAALIRDFEDVAERQTGQPGGVGVDSSPIAMAIEKEGDDAVEPLLECLEKDDRLTRSVSFGRDFFPDRNLISVASVAYAGLGHILGTKTFGAASDVRNRGGGATRKDLADEIRAFWKKNKGKSPAERWYATLADDHADPSQWIEAARLIVQPTDVEERGGWIVTQNRKDGKVPPIRGEELRGKKNPSVSDLIAKRIPMIAAQDPGNSGFVFAQDYATQVALALAKWDPAAAIPAVREQLQRCKDVESGIYAGDQTNELMARDISELSAILTATGDRGAFREYAQWIQSQKPERQGGFGEAKPFEVMWQHPDDPDIAAAAEKVFNDPSSPWRCRVKDGALGMGPESELITTPLLAMPAFRKNVLDNLNDTTKIGAVMVNGSQVNVKTDAGGNLGIGSNPDPADPLVPKPNEERAFRVCDWYAYRLSGLDGSPQFELYWPQDKRDAAIKACSAYLQEWAGAFRYSEVQKALNFMGMDMMGPRMTFPKRDKPATDTDVKAHAAIFAAPAGAEARAVALKRFPVKAKWTTLKRFPTRSQGFDTNTNKNIVINDFDQSGLVWQVEEVKENGKWKRYYGFVGRHIIAMVPAEEIQIFEDVDPSDPSVP